MYHLTVNNNALDDNRGRALGGFSATLPDKVRPPLVAEKSQHDQQIEQAFIKERRQREAGGSGGGGNSSDGGGGSNEGRRNEWNMMVEQTAGRVSSAMGNVDITIRAQVGTRGWVHSEEINGQQTGHITGHPDGGIHRHGSLWDGGNGKLKGWDKTNGQPPSGGILDGFFKR